MTPLTSTSSFLAKLLQPRLLSGLRPHPPTGVMMATTQLAPFASQPPAPSSFPERPSRPLTSYMRFLRDKRDMMRGVPIAEGSKRLSEQWKALSEAQRAHYQQQYEKDLAQFAAKKEAWVKLMQEQDLMEKYQAEAKTESLRRDYQKALLHRRQARKSLERPKRAKTPFIFYMNDEFKDYASAGQSGQAHVQSFVAVAAQHYKQLTPAQKESLQRRYEEDRKRFEAELAEWEKDADKVRKWEEANDQVMKTLLKMRQASAPPAPEKPKEKEKKAGKKSGKAKGKE